MMDVIQVRIGSISGGSDDDSSIDYFYYQVLEPPAEA